MAPPAPRLILITSEPLQSLQSLPFYYDLHSFAPSPVAMAPPARRLLLITSEPHQSLQSLPFYNDLHSFAPFPMATAPPTARLILIIDAVVLAFRHPGVMSRCYNVLVQAAIVLVRNSGGCRGTRHNIGDIDKTI